MEEAFATAIGGVYLVALLLLLLLTSCGATPPLRWRNHVKDPPSNLIKRLGLAESWRSVLVTLILVSEYGSLIMMLIGVQAAGNKTAYLVEAFGFLALLLWLIASVQSSSSDAKPLSPWPRYVAIVTWLLFCGLFTFALPVVLFTAGQTYEANLTLWHAVHRFVVDGLYTLTLCGLGATTTKPGALMHIGFIATH